MEKEKPYRGRTETMVRNSLGQKRLQELLNFKFSMAPMTQGIQDNYLLMAYQCLEDVIAVIVKLEAEIQDIP